MRIAKKYPHLHFKKKNLRGQLAAQVDRDLAIQGMGSHIPLAHGQLGSRHGGMGCQHAPRPWAARSMLPKDRRSRSGRPWPGWLDPSRPQPWGHTVSDPAADNNFFLFLKKFASEVGAASLGAVEFGYHYLVGQSTSSRDNFVIIIIFFS